MKLLIVGALEGQLGKASMIAREKGATVSQCPDREAALQKLRSGGGVELILMQLKDNVPALLEALRAEHIHVPVVACGLESDSEAAAAAIRAGALEYLPLPPDKDMIAALLASIAEEKQEMIAAAPAMKEALRLAEQIAPSDASVLITGESGTGKEVIARHIHLKSRRAERNFVSVNCAAIPENLLESELFGHEKGAFTGAVARRIGKFEEASGGTLLLDEISEMDMRLQAKLLRAIQEREIDRVGGSGPVKVDLRILATSNRDLPAEVAAGTFRQDLYYRLNVISLHLPPLRERKEDIPALAAHFAAHYAEVNRLPPRPLTPDAIERLTEYRWPGNVRELENTLHRAVLLASGDSISAQAILLAPASAAGGGSTGVRGQVGRSITSVERDLILETLDHCLGNRDRAAEILGISIRALRDRLKQYEGG